MNSREYFESIRDEVKGIDDAYEMLERMKSIEGAKAQSYQPMYGKGGAHDPMDAVSRRIDFERRLMQRIEDGRESVDRACEVLYGKDGHGGLAKVKGTRYADAICMYYCQAETWAEIADVMQSSQKWCRELCNVGFDFIDAYGWAQLRES